MTTKNKKRFGVWMDTQHATVVGYETPDATGFTILGHIDNPGKALVQKYFKEIVQRHPKTKYSEYSANLLLDMYNLKKDYAGLEKMRSAYLSSGAAFLLRSIP